MSRLSVFIRAVGIGLLIALLIEGVARAIFAVNLEMDYLPFSYAAYPDNWPYWMMGVTMFASFIGAMMVIHISSNKNFPFAVYLLLLVGWKLLPLSLAPNEPVWIVAVSAILAVGAAFSSRQFIVQSRGDRR